MLQLLLSKFKRGYEERVIIELYCPLACPYCKLARKYLKDKGMDYQEFHVDMDKVFWWKTEYSDQRETLPQIFVNGYHVGGYGDLLEMEKNKQIEKLL